MDSYSLQPIKTSARPFRKMIADKNADHQLEVFDDGYVMCRSLKSTHNLYNPNICNLAYKYAVGDTIMFTVDSKVFVS
jgi:hypothetical protein